MTLQQAKIKQATWAIAFAFTSMIIIGLVDNIRGPLFPEVLNYFNLTSIKGSWSFATTSMAAFIGSYLTTAFLKKYSMSQLLLTAVMLMAIGMFVMGVAPNFNLFIVGSFVIGASIGSMAVAQNLLVSESVKPENKSRALSGLHAMYGLASFIAPLLASIATNETSSWRSAFLIISGISFVYCMVHIFVKADPPFHIHVHVHETEKAEQVTVPFKSLILIGGIFAFYVVAEIMIGTRLAQYMRNYYSMDLSQSSLYVTYFFLFLLVGRVFFALKKIAIPIKKQMNISLTISLILLIIGLNFHPLVLTLVGLAMAPFYPLSVAYISEVSGSYGRRFLTFAMAFQSLAVVTMHLGVGYLTDTLGLFYAFGVGIFALVLSLVCLNFHPKKLV